MDPLSQAVVGASLSQSFARKNEFKAATLAGLLGGLLPDMDVLIKSKSDPLLSIEYHRHFTHSLFFVPVLALVVAAFLFYFYKRQSPFKRLYFYSFLGVLTHGLLDACTSYGTQLFWPLSNMRVAWNNVAIIDPLFTLPVLGLIIWACFKCNVRVARASFIYLVLYLLLGVYQRDSALSELRALAQSRNHEPVRITVKPSIGNNFLFRSIYETPEGVFYVDAIRSLPWSKKVYEGASAERFYPDSLSVSEDSVLMKDIKRFAWFSDDYLVLKEGVPKIVGDLRYSSIPNSLDFLWGISVDEKRAHEHVDFIHFRQVNDKLWQDFKNMLWGK
jgi:inner membrane protein